MKLETKAQHWSDSRFRLTDTLIETWVTHNHVGIYMDSPSLLFNKIQKEKKKQNKMSIAEKPSSK